MASNPNYLISSFFFIFFLVVISSEEVSQDKDHFYDGSTYSAKTRCSHHGPPIRFPFSLNNHRNIGSGYPGFDLSCTVGKDTVLQLPHGGEFLVTEINYTSQEITVSDPDGCIVRRLLHLNLSSSPFSQVKGVRFHYNLTIFNCSITNNDILDVAYYRAVPINCLNVRDYRVFARCRLKKERSIGSPNKDLNETECFFIPNIHAKALAILGLVIAASVVAKRRYNASRLDKLERVNKAKIEKFLEDYKSLKPTRYSYADIKRMTNHFQIKLGEGGYGSVFKGMLSNEIPVAVKILNCAKDNGEDFINEVGTMGTIHHVNVVRLFGFCADGFHRALVYEFLHNDSLEKFIFLSNSKNPFLGWPKLQDIAVGIAKGIEYLHQGCDQRILHFDIKPHNILLDYNLNPKISDFGLAKLCSKDKSAVSMSAARGTMGYIAPEVVSRNFGNVSHKSDVYSFGMMLLEMVGGRKNIDATAENSSQVYFPEWIYSRIHEAGKHLKMKGESEDDEKIAKKLSIVGLWCIQWYPLDRPSMSSVIQLLEEETAKLSIPPNPFASNTTTPENNTRRNIHDRPGDHHALDIISEHDELE
ncbi:hypothetical protein Sjap_021686 [Stephania japonica]|uniref:Protein kinase domain-containing protein n=1 Tax=Stephania japonica TaxID=461633 RepID=A0AAP0EW91_9MAGN